MINEINGFYVILYEGNKNVIETIYYKKGVLC